MSTLSDVSSEKQATALEQLFEDAYGIKECVVRLVLPTESRNFADFEEWLHELTSSAIFKTEEFNYPLIPPTTFRDGTIQLQPDRSLHSLRYNVFRQPKIGPKSRTRHRFFTSFSEEESLAGSVLNYSFTEPDVQLSKNVYVMSKPKIGPKSRISHIIDSPVPKSKMESKFQVNSANASAGNNIIRSVERAQQHLTKYFAETDRNAQSSKHFWNDFFRSEFEEVETLNGMKIEPQALVVDPHPVRCAEHSDGNNETYSSDVQIIELPPEEPIEISDDETQLLFGQLQVDRNDTEDLVVPIEISQSTSSKKLSALASTSKGSRNIAAEPVQNNLSVDCVDFQSFSQQSLLHPSNENFQIEERTNSESQHQGL